MKFDETYFTAMAAYEDALLLLRSPSNATREIACQDPEWAWKYAYYIDKCPRDDTREASCKMYMQNM